MPIVYQVEPGDTLTGIALKKTGQSKHWRKLWLANRKTLRDPDSIRAGDTLIIPQDFLLLEFEHLERRRAKECKMAMSKDRVEFDLNDYESNFKATVDAAVRAFAMTPQQANHAVRNGKRIRCRPSQFARFLIYRSENVSVNRFGCLNAKLVPAVDHEEIIDVSGRDRTDGC